MVIGSVISDRVIPLQFPHRLRSPFLGTLAITPSFHPEGTIPVTHISLNNFLKINTNPVLLFVTPFIFWKLRPPFGTSSLFLELCPPSWNFIPLLGNPSPLFDYGCPFCKSVPFNNSVTFFQLTLPFCNSVPLFVTPSPFL